MEILVHLVRLFIWLGKKATAGASPGTPLRADALARQDSLLRRGGGPKVAASRASAPGASRSAAPPCNPIWQRDDHLT